MISLAIIGAGGRMGLRLIALAQQDKDFKVVGAVEQAGHPSQGRDAGEAAGIGAIGTLITHDLACTPRVVIDFSTPASTRHWLEVCRARGIAMVIGTTSLQAEYQQAIAQAAGSIPVLQSPNMSLGVNVLFKIVGQVVRMLGDDYDKEIVEAHHRFKKDAPSGTAMGLADAILQAMGKDRSALDFDRHGDDCPRQPGQVGMHALRMGDEVGRHTVYFAAPGERLEFTHVATNRDTFAHGALRAARWLVEQKAGRYTVGDMLGL